MSKLRVSEHVGLIRSVTSSYLHAVLQYSRAIELLLLTRLSKEGNGFVSEI